jgi:hypothetical protein
MSRQPIIIQVLSQADRRTIQRRLMAMGLLTAVFVAVALLFVLYYEQDSTHTLITGAIVLVLVGNVLLLFRNRMIDRYSESLCLDGSRCYTVTKNGVTQYQPAVYLRYKQEQLVINSELEKERPSKKTFAFQVLDRYDWKAVQQHKAS